VLPQATSRGIMTLHNICLVDEANDYGRMREAGAYVAVLHAMREVPLALDIVPQAMFFINAALQNDPGATDAFTRLGAAPLLLKGLEDHPCRDGGDEDTLLGALSALNALHMLCMAGEETRAFVAGEGVARYFDAVVEVCPDKEVAADFRKLQAEIYKT
jgi:hypothetical protein